jgi:putative flavoprotein involved in K+ transport
MQTPDVEGVIIGGGPAGLGVSYRLTMAGCPHVVLEQGRIGESWRSRRWDSLRLVGPNWALQFPGWAYHGDDPQGFMPKDEVVACIEAYASSFNPPVREGVCATAAASTCRRAVAGRPRPGTAGMTLSGGSSVSAGSTARRPRMPAINHRPPARTAAGYSTCTRWPGRG